MSETHAYWEEVERTFDHLTPVKTPDLFAERDPKYNPVLQIRQWLLRPAAHHKYLVTGTVGNGKTSELYHACAQLAEHRMVVFVDLWEHFRHRVGDVRALERLEPWELLGLLGLAIIRAGEERFEHKWQGEPKALEAAIKALRVVDGGDGGAAEIDVITLAKGMAIAAGGVVGAALGGPVVESGLQVIQSTADVVSWTWKIGLQGNLRRSDQETEVGALLAAVNRLIMTLQAEYGRRLLLMVDGIDRVEDSDRLRTLFVESTLLGELVCDEVFTAPIDNDLTQQARAFRCYDLCNVPVLSREDPTTHGPGIKFFQVLVDKRLAAVKQTLAERGIKPPCAEPMPTELVARLAYYSGGVVREFVRMVAFAAGEAWSAEVEALTDAIVDEVLNDARALKELRITSDEIALLEQIMEDPDHVVPTGEMAQKLLRDHRLFPYPNETPWYYPNPVLTLKQLRPGRRSNR